MFRPAADGHLTQNSGVKSHLEHRFVIGGGGSSRPQGELAGVALDVFGHAQL